MNQFQINPFADFISNAYTAPAMFVVCTRFGVLKGPYWFD